MRQLPYGQHLMTAYTVAGWWYRDTKQTEVGLAWLASLVATAQARNDRWMLGYLLSNPGCWLNEGIGDVPTLLHNFEQARAIGAAIGDEVLHSYALTFLGLLDWQLGNLAHAEALHREALVMQERGLALHMRVLSRAGIGFVRLCYAYTMVGRRAEAAELYQTVAIKDETTGWSSVDRQCAGRSGTPCGDASGFSGDLSHHCRRPPRCRSAAFGAVVAQTRRS